MTAKDLANGQAVNRWSWSLDFIDRWFHVRPHGRHIARRCSAGESRGQGAERANIREKPAACRDRCVPGFRRVADQHRERGPGRGGPRHSGVPAASHETHEARPPGRPGHMVRRRDHSRDPAVAEHPVGPELPLFRRLRRHHDQLLLERCGTPESTNGFFGSQCAAVWKLITHL